MLNLAPVHLPPMQRLESNAVRDLTPDILVMFRHRLQHAASLNCAPDETIRIPKLHYIDSFWASASPPFKISSDDHDSRCQMSSLWHRQFPDATLGRRPTAARELTEQLPLAMDCPPPQPQSSATTNIIYCLPFYKQLSEWISSGFMQYFIMHWNIVIRDPSINDFMHRMWNLDHKLESILNV
ncbi:hypothetical protein J6590_044381 [Homalodisca vitripennis]|nr:hypothetical protein J6590_044381 [Homalodisca vitripennis]